MDEDKRIFCMFDLRMHILLASLVASFVTTILHAVFLNPFFKNSAALNEYFLSFARFEGTTGFWLIVIGYVSLLFMGISKKCDTYVLNIKILQNLKLQSAKENFRLNNYTWLFLATAGILIFCMYFIPLALMYFQESMYTAFLFSNRLANVIISFCFVCGASTLLIYYSISALLAATELILNKEKLNAYIEGK